MARTINWHLNREIPEYIYDRLPQGTRTGRITSARRDEKTGRFIMDIEHDKPRFMAADYSSIEDRILAFHSLASGFINADFNFIEDEEIPKEMTAHKTVHTVRVVFNQKPNGQMIRTTDDAFHTLTKYDYITEDNSIKAGDTCVVHVTNRGVLNGLRFVTVVEVLQNTRTSEATKYIVSRVNAEEYFARVENARNAAKIRTRLREIEVEEAERDKFKKLAEKNSVASQLLEELDKLEGRKVTNTPSTDIPPAPRAGSLPLETAVDILTQQGTNKRSDEPLTGPDDIPF